MHRKWVGAAEQSILEENWRERSYCCPWSQMQGLCEGNHLLSIALGTVHLCACSSRWIYASAAFYVCSNV